MAGLCVTLFNIGRIHMQHQDEQAALSTWVNVYETAKKIGYAQALDALENLARERGGEGLEYWERLPQQNDQEE